MQGMRVGYDRHTDRSAVRLIDHQLQPTRRPIEPTNIGLRR